MDFLTYGLFDFKLSDGTILGAEFDESGAALIELPEGVPAAMKVGSGFEISNDFFLALATLHRHQIPVRDGFFGFDQFRDAGGKPLYPQRPIDIAKPIAASTSGSGTFTGNITGKVICVNNIVDSEAFTLHADWYLRDVKKALGDRFADSYRLWYQDHSDQYMHPIEPRKEKYLVDFTGVYHQALQDLAAWVENGTAPPATTGYQIKDGQVVLARSAKDRHGIQPVVNSGALRDTPRQEDQPQGRIGHLWVLHHC